MKIPFDIKYRPQIESGEYKVETREGKPARIICWDLYTRLYKIVALVRDDTFEKIEAYNIKGLYNERSTSIFDLFIITPEPELTDFEREFKAIVEDEFGAVTPVSDTDVRKACEKLLDLAKRELCKDCPSRGNTHAYLQGKKDALNDLPKWKKVETNAFYPDIAYSGKGKCPMLHYGEYEINIVKLKKALPKEEE